MERCTSIKTCQPMIKQFMIVQKTVSVEIPFYKFVFPIKKFKIIHCYIILIQSFSPVKHMETILIYQLKCHSRHK